MKSASGREVSARIVERLRDALNDGRARTYAELAQAAKCTERSVRNYLAQDTKTLGFRVSTERGPDRRIYVRMEPTDVAGTMEELAQVLARDMLRKIFPIAGTSLEKAKRQPGTHVIVAVRGAYEYDEANLRTLRTWLVASKSRPRQQVHFNYEGAQNGLRASWPLGIVIRDLARVYLLGVPSDAIDAREVRTYALERTSSLKIVPSADGDAPAGMNVAAIEQAMDLPFSVSHAQGGVRVHVRFSKEQAKFIRNRRWHKHQKMTTRRDGSLDVKFGPADLREVQAWVAQWGDSIEVLGDASLVRTLRG